MIVVARYNEDVSWTKPFSNRCIIYNKGEPLGEEYPNEVLLPNVGKEGHTYYTHIVQNYHDISKQTDFVVFLQGNPFDHTPDIMNKLYGLLETGGQGGIAIETDFEELSERVERCTLNECFYHTGLPLKDIYQELFGDGSCRNRENLEIEFGGGAQFVVSKKRIRQHPKEFYQRIVQLLDKETSPVEGYVIERFHRIIFGDAHPGFY